MAWRIRDDVFRNRHDAAKVHYKPTIGQTLSCLPHSLPISRPSHPLSPETLAFHPWSKTGFVILSSRKVISPLYHYEPSVTRWIAIWGVLIRGEKKKANPSTSTPACSPVLRQSWSMKPFYGMVKLQNQFLIMGEMPLTLPLPDS